ncbi:SufS family cysteine desulfurase [bacterium]|nr:SufS family cysteine desulfurase [bacterium]
MQQQAGFDVEAVRAQFPALHQQARGQRLAYLDNAATTQKPQAVIDALAHYYSHDNSNVHRGAHALAERATEGYESARDAIAGLLNARSREQIVFTKGTTDGINLVAAGLAQTVLKPGKAVLVSELEHHSNLVPWQLACQRSGAELRWLDLLPDGSLDLSKLKDKLRDVAIVALGHYSNSLGSIHPVAQIIDAAHAAGALVLLDGAQAMAHQPVDVQALDVDFYAFSGHKMFGPTGIGALYGKAEVLDALPPYQGGGEMIETVEMAASTWNAVPYKFEAGTPNIAGAIGLGAACAWLQSLDRPAAGAHEAELLEAATAAVTAVPGTQLVGTAAAKTSVVSFVADWAHPQDIGAIMDQAGVAIRTGHHCCMPAMAKLGLPGTVRASMSVYNTSDDIAQLGDALKTAHRLFA